VKKIKLHKTLSRRFRLKAQIIIGLFFFADVKARYIESAIKINNMLHAIGKIKLGGVIAGFADSYHAPIFVKKLPMPATANTIAKHNASKNLLIFFFTAFFAILSLNDYAFYSLLLRSPEALLKRDPGE